MSRGDGLGWLKGYGSAVWIGTAVLAVLISLLVSGRETGSWLLAAAHNSSDWLRGKLVDEGLWVVAVFFVWLVASLVASRVIALFVWPSMKSGISERVWSCFALIGLLLVLLGVGIWTLVGTVVAPREADFNSLILFAVCAVIAGIIMLGLGLGQRLRLQINVTGSDAKTDPVKSAYLVARMEALGTSRPRGLEFPHGTDIAHLPETALSSATTDESKIVAAILTMFRSVAFIIPWKAEVVIVDSATAAVTLRRNGRRFDSQLISTSFLLPDNPSYKAADVERAVLTAAAAYILFSLSRVYPSLKEGMSGATNWRGVAAQVLATTVPWNKDPQTSLQLLATAVDEDPRNLAAWLAYLVKRTGFYGTPETLDWVRGSLKTLKDALDELGVKEIALNMRLLRTLTIFSTNLRVQLENLKSGKSDPEKQELQGRIEKVTREALDHVSSLVDKVEDASSMSRQRMLQEYAQRIRPLTAALYLHVVNLQVPSPEKAEEQESRANLDKAKDREEWAKKWIWNPTDPKAGPKEIPDEEMFYLSSLRFHYDRACALLEENRENHLKPLAHLELALSLTDLRTGAESDPSLQPIREEEQFEAIIEKKVRITSLTALEGTSKKLAAEGIRFASDFVARIDGDRQLSDSLKVAEYTVKWMRGICELAEGCPQRQIAADWTNLLTDEGINNAECLRTFVAALGQNDIASKASCARMNRRAEIASIKAPEKTDFDRWAESISTPETPAHAAAFNWNIWRLGRKTV